jgi:hypothetical protein
MNFNKLHEAYWPFYLYSMVYYEKGELPRLECLHNGIILIVICYQEQI